MSAKDIAGLAAVLASEGRKVPPHIIAADTLALRRLGAGFSRRAVMACNGVRRWHGRDGWIQGWTEGDEAAKERADDRAKAKAAEIAKRYRAKVTTHGDPRGCVFRLHFRSGRRNGMGDGWGVM